MWDLSKIKNLSPVKFERGAKLSPGTSNNHTWGPSVIRKVDYAAMGWYETTLWVHNLKSLHVTALLRVSWISWHFVSFRVSGCIRGMKTCHFVPGGGQIEVYLISTHFWRSLGFRVISCHFVSKAVYGAWKRVISCQGVPPNWGYLISTKIERVISCLLTFVPCCATACHFVSNP